ncbi:MAG: beta-3-deoxy-D-manno-oct-2-ulosonic acid transferase [Succinivibrionaceae bacterium]|nr:beta-3-deoxy-D-manno-oct-2-ulosonic acid transferase [Succinivibrionaceae bacterium]
MKENIYLLDFSFWKKKFLSCFFPEGNCIFISSEKFLSLISKHRISRDAPATVAIWATAKDSRSAKAIRGQIRTLPLMKLVYLEDGFIRSLGLGSNFYYPYSLVADDLGIYFDPSAPSRLEKIMEETLTREDRRDQLERAEKLRKSIIDHRQSKYYRASERQFLKRVADLKGHIRHNEEIGRIFEKVIFVPGQVSDDASVLAGGCGYDIISLLKEVRSKYPDGCIIVKVHPDAYSGNRNGGATVDELNRYADMVFTSEFNSLECIEAAEEVHTISSLTGFEALLRGKKVICYGMPFYAGYGLTEDVAVARRHPVALAARERRYRQGYTLQDLIYAALISYPLYYNWEITHTTDAEGIVQQFAGMSESRRSLFCYAVFFGLVKPWMRLTGKA